MKIEKRDKDFSACLSLLECPSFNLEVHIINPDSKVQKVHTLLKYKFDYFLRGEF